MRSCLVEEEAHQAALRDDYDMFLRARSETLHRRLMALNGSAAQPLSGVTEPEAVPAEAGDELDYDESFLAEEPVDRDSTD